MKLCKEIEVVIRRFCWGQKDEQRRIHWIRWEKLCNPKGMESLGFRELHTFSLALLAKQIWRLLHCSNSLFYKVFSVKFFPHGTIMDASIHKRRSFAWHSILKVRDLIIAGLSWKMVIIL
jgi:hypothetical protein